ncbi:MAG: type II toxin-antitoxin system RelE/ParE family toxin [Crocosphaera sp.]|nr:type II toxin-antitoxin system RelE/ParE family toxin [Crocosphaera sp.]
MNETQEYQIRLTDLALEMLEKIKDQRHLQLLSKRIDQLKLSPEKQGKPLTDKLKGYRSIRAVGQRYRIIYQVVKSEVTVYIIGVGLRQEGSRKDIYNKLEKLLDDNL